MTLDQQQQQQQQQQTVSQPADAQNLFGETALPQQNAIEDWDNGPYDPSTEEGGDEEFLENLSNIVDVQTPAPTMKSVTDKTPPGAFSEKIFSLDRRVYHPLYTDEMNTEE